MDIEWAKDGNTGKLYIVQARPETVQSQKGETDFQVYKLKEKGTVLVSGIAVGDSISVGPARVIRRVEDISKFEEGCV